MSFTQHNDLLFEAYLENRLTTSERAEFESRLQEDKEFKTEFELHKDAYKLLSLYSQKTTRLELQKIEEKISKESGSFAAKANNPFASTWMKVAAAFLVLAVSTLVFANLTHSNDAIFEKHFSPFQDVVTIKGGDVSAESLLQSGMQYYNLKDFDRAIEFYQEVLKRDPQNEHASFYLAMSYLASGQPQKADTYLEKSRQTGNFAEEATEWYSVLALLDQGKTAEAQKELKVIIANPNHSYKERAEKLMKHISSFWYNLTF